MRDAWPALVVFDGTGSVKRDA